MAHTHDVHDTGKRFEINGISRFIKETSETKLVLVQGDHKSEVVTFEMPRFIDGHDMLLCNKIRVHYINIDTKTSDSSADIYEVTDLKLCEDCGEEETLLFTWTIEAPATKYFGSLSFLVKFECTEGDNILYQWNTARYVNVNVLNGIDNSEAFVDKYSNVLEEWYNKLMGESETVVNLIETVGQQLEDCEKETKAVANAVNGKQNTLVSGINIKTINGNSILGSGNILIEGGSGGSIIVDQTYTPTSENPQSGTAVAGAISNLVSLEDNTEWIFDGGDASGSVGIDLVIDAEMSDTSNNPVSNKVIKKYVDNMVDLIYPVGSIYMSANDTSPSILFGGEWERIEDRFLLAAGNTYSAGSTGGEAEHTLTENEIPLHNHGSKSLVGYMWNIASQSDTHNLETTKDGIVSTAMVEGHGYAMNSTTEAVDGFKIDATHTHNSFGGGKSHNNMPPYLAVYMWQRIS